MRVTAASLSFCLRASTTVQTVVMEGSVLGYKDFYQTNKWNPQNHFQHHSGPVQPVCCVVIYRLFWFMEEKLSFLSRCVYKYGRKSLKISVFLFEERRSLKTLCSGVLFSGEENE